MNNKMLLEKLIHFAELILSDIDTGLKSGKYVPANLPCKKHVIQKYEYGQPNYGGSLIDTTKHDWYSCISIAVHECQNFRNFSEICKYLEEDFDEIKSKSALLSFIQELAKRRFHNSVFHYNNIHEFAMYFINELNGNNNTYRAYIEMDGIYISESPVIISLGRMYIHIRRTDKKDLETEVDAFPVYQPLKNIPSAIVTIESAAESDEAFQFKVCKIENVLRLFRVGSIRFLEYSIESHSIVHSDLGKTIHRTGHKESKFNYELDGENERDSCERFLQAINQRYIDFIANGMVKGRSHIAIAYLRYCDTLMQKDLFERGVATTVMGFESLFLEGGPELKYKLSLRISILMKYFGFDGLTVNEEIKKAYDIRSSFVHGDRIKDKQSQSIINQYGNVLSFEEKLLDYLRIAIISSLMAKMSKKEFVKLLDESLLDDNAENRLVQKLQGAKEVVQLCMKQ